jgi:hypothetical protein
MASAKAQDSGVQVRDILSALCPLPSVLASDQHSTHMFRILVQWFHIHLQ